jgi:hypothetical protein
MDAFPFMHPYCKPFVVSLPYPLLSDPVWPGLAWPEPDFIVIPSRTGMAYYGLVWYRTSTRNTQHTRRDTVERWLVRSRERGVTTHSCFISRHIIDVSSYSSNVRLALETLLLVSLGTVVTVWYGTVGQQYISGWGCTFRIISYQSHLRHHPTPIHEVYKCRHGLRHAGRSVELAAASQLVTMDSRHGFLGHYQV